MTPLVHALETALRAGRWLGLAAVLLAAAAGPAQAAKRLALVIGNGAYENVAKLPNARNDADATARMLADARFDVRRAMDASLTDLRSAVERFADAVENAGSGSVAVVYYAGHAIQRHGNNHLLPIDVKPSSEEEIPAQSVTLGEILKRLDGTSVATKVFILDACRDNPFQADVAPARGLAVALLDNPGKTESGLARVELKGGTFVAFSTSPGRTAADGSGEHSPFTQAFLQFAREPGVPVEAVFRKVRMSVHDATSGGQIPWETSSLTKPFSFFDAGTGNPNLELASADTGSAADRSAARSGLGPKPTRESLKALPAAEAYTLVVAWDMPETYRLFLDIYGDDLLALRVHRILGTRLEEMAWAMAARWGDPAHLRRYAAVFEGSAHAGEARAMASAGGAPGAKVCTPAMPNGVSPIKPIQRRADLAPKGRKHAATAPASGRARAVQTAIEEEGDAYDAPPPIAALNPAIFFGRPGGIRVNPPTRGYPQTYSPAFHRFIDAGQSGAVPGRNVPPSLGTPGRASGISVPVRSSSATPPVLRGAPTPILTRGSIGTMSRGTVSTRPTMGVPGMYPVLGGSLVPR